MFAACVEGLTELAGELSLEDFSAVLAEWVDLVDDQAPHDDSKRRLSSSDVGGSGHHRDRRLRPKTPPSSAPPSKPTTPPTPSTAPEGPRSREQRHHDIAIDIFRRALADKLGEDPMTPGGVDVIVDAETAAEVVADPTSRSTSRRLRTSCGPSGDGDAEPVQAPHAASTPTAPGARRAFAAALICSGLVRRIIIDPDTGAVLDVGRAQRRFTRRQFRALVVRDGGCVFPGCDRKPKWCDAHHLKPWEDHGPTDLDNGCLLCRRHHILVHHGGWTLERDPRPGSFTATSPDGRKFTRRPDKPAADPMIRTHWTRHGPEGPPQPMSLVTPASGGRSKPSSRRSRSWRRRARRSAARSPRSGVRLDRRPRVAARRRER